MVTTDLSIGEPSTIFITSRVWPANKAWSPSSILTAYNWGSYGPALNGTCSSRAHGIISTGISGLNLTTVVLGLKGPIWPLTFPNSSTTWTANLGSFHGVIGEATGLVVTVTIHVATFQKGTLVWFTNILNTCIGCTHGIIPTYLSIRETSTIQATLKVGFILWPINEAWGPCSILTAYHWSSSGPALNATCHSGAHGIISTGISSLNLTTVVLGLKCPIWSLAFPDSETTWTANLGSFHGVIGEATGLVLAVTIHVATFQRGTLVWFTDILHTGIGSTHGMVSTNLSIGQACTV